MKLKDMRFRQVHLDFHTSEKIMGVGSKFDEKKFVDTLKAASVNSITLFSKCHHGMSYHDTKIGLRHPGLKFNLLDKMMKACKKEGINTPIYLSAGFDEYQADKNPQWREQRPGESEQANLSACWKKMCFGTPYLDYLCRQIEEVMEKYNGGDGIMLDIVLAGECACTYCIKGMLALGLDPEKSEDRKEYNKKVFENYYTRTTEAVRKKRKDCPIFHNSGHVQKGDRNFFRHFSHLELESLPTGGWGYDHFPISASYVSNLGMQYLGMTGKFHTWWGEFGGYKNANALKYECAQMLAFGAKCSIGDQLHPDGHIDTDTYRIIGEAYKLVAEREQWCINAKQVTEVGVFTSECFGKTDNFGNAPDAGAARMLLEKHIPFTLIDHVVDFNKFKLIILPDTIRLNAQLKQKLLSYLKKGGAVIASDESLLDSVKDEFAIDLGAKYDGKSEWAPDYIAADKLSEGIVTAPFVMYERASKIIPKKCLILSTAMKPYFNRAYNHFCSHQHTPYASDAGYPAVIQKGNLIYFAHPIFKAYKNMGQQLYRDIFYNAVLKLIKPSLKTSLPSAARVTLTEQAENRRMVLHTFFSYKQLRGSNIEVIEDIVPLRNIAVSLNTGRKIRNIVLQPQGKNISFKQINSILVFEIPEISIHQMVSIEW